MPTTSPLRALPAGPHHLLLVNHLTTLDPHALSHLLACADRVARYNACPSIIVGATRCPATQTLATSGLNRSSPRARTYTQVTPTLAPLPVDTFNPNCLLIPAPLLPAILSRPLTPSLGHHLRRQGYALFLAPHFVGTCPLTSVRHRRARPGSPV